MPAARRLPPKLLLLAALSACHPAAAADPPARPRSPQEASATLHLADPRLTIELVAAEPDVISPVAVAWDEDGRMFVAEMIDYPVSPASGRIKQLEDRDGDGRYEHASVFAEGLPYPTSVLPWSGGVLVTAAPNLWFLKDHDGDGKADERRVLFTGFSEGNQQLRVNGLTYGLDNWIYGANGRSDGEIKRAGDPSGKVVSIRRRDFRFRPATGAFEAVAGFSQFGLARDDWGNRFVSWNTIPLRHVVLEDDVLSRNKYLAESTTVAAILDTADGGRVYAISPVLQRYNRESVAFFNASCGPTVFRGDSLPEDYRVDAFVCESLSNLVHRRKLVASGPTFVARRVEQGKEFLASTDSSFRPVNVATGPDGALYVVDFYRELVEHPQFVPEAMRNSVNFRRWYDRGRIWRIRAKERTAPETSQPRPQLRRAKAAELVVLLGHPNGWWRDTAQRLLVERQDPEAAAPLAECARTSTNPLARLHALWTLDGLGRLDEGLLVAALRDPSPGVRENAVRLARGIPALGRRVAGLAEDSEIRVRFQAAIALGGRTDPDSLKALARIATRDASDVWVRLAILSGLQETAWPFLQRLIETQPSWRSNPSPEQESLLSRVGAVVGASGREAERESLLALVSGSGDRIGAPWALLSGLVEGAARSGRALSVPTVDGKSAGSGLPRLLRTALDDVVFSDREPPERRVRALEFAARLRPDLVAGSLGRLLEAKQPPAVQLAAARALALGARPEVASEVLEHWGEYGTGVRRELLLAISGSPALAERLVAAMERGDINPAELDPSSREALKRIAEPALKRRIEALLAKSAPPDRGAVLRKYQAALSTAGDAGRGELLFAKNCQTCHQKRGKGHKVGPDLSGVAGRPPSALLNDILDPSREVAPDYVSFVLVTKRGQVVSGLLAEETGTSLKLRRNEGVEETVLMSEVEEFRSTGRSLMPEGLEQSLGVQDVADLLEYLRQP